MRSFVARVVLFSVCWFGAPAAASAAGFQRFASPSGTGVSCTASAPCDLATAVTYAQAGDEIVVAGGDYGSAAAPLTASITTSKVGVTVRGASALDRPRLHFAVSTTPSAPDGLVVTGSGSTIQDLDVHNAATGPGADAIYAVAPGVTVNRVIATTDGTSPSASSRSIALTVNPDAVVRDSVARATDLGSRALLVTGLFAGTRTGELRHVTLAVPPTSSTVALDLVTSSSNSWSVNVVNSIVLGQNGPTARNGWGPDSGMYVTFSHTAYAKVTTGYVSNVTVSADDTNTTFPPLLADPAGGDLHQQSTSAATIDQGAVDSGDEATDLDGTVRSIGRSPDLGAYEQPLPPTAVVGAVDASIDSATVTGLVNTGGANATVHADYTAGGVTKSTSDVVVPLRALADQPVAIALRGLQAATTYRVVLVATSVAGAVSSAPSTFTTNAAPTSAVPPILPAGAMVTAAPVATPAPVGTAVPVAPAAVKILSTTIKVSSRGVATLKLRNTQTKSIVVQARIPKLTGTVKRSIKAGKSASVMLRLTKTGFAQLKKAKGGRLSVNVVLDVVSATGKQTLRLPISIRRP